MDTFLGYFVSICDNASDTEVSEVWSLETDQEILIGGYIYAAFLFLFLVLGLPWNLIIIGIILKKRLYKRPTVLLLLNLAISDLIFIVLVIPVQISTAITAEYWAILSSDKAKCIACETGVVSAIVIFASLLTISFMSFDRFLFIYKPLKYHRLITSARVLVILTVMWIFCTVVAIFPVVGFGYVIFDALFLTCTDDISGTFSNINIAYAVFVYTVYSIPITLLVIFNLLVVYIVVKNIRVVYNIRRLTVSTVKRKTKSVKSMSKKRHDKELHLVNVFGGLLLANLISWLPVMSFGIITVTSREFDIIPYPLHTVSVTLFMMQVVTHPLVETVLLKDIKDPIKALLCPCLQKGSRFNFTPTDSARPRSCCGYHNGDDDGDTTSPSECGCIALINAAILKHSNDVDSTSDSVQTMGTSVNEDVQHEMDTVNSIRTTANQSPDNGIIDTSVAL